MQKLLTLNELRQSMPAYVEKVRKGASFVVYKKSQPIFRIEPVDAGEWEEVIDFTKVRKGGVAIDDILSRL